MGFVLLGVFTAIEIALLVITFTKRQEKADWLQNRVICRAAETAVFVLALLLPQVSWDFRFRLCFFILLIRAILALVIWLLRKKKTSGKKSKPGAALSAFGGILILALSLVPAFLFTGYEGLETTGVYGVKQVRAILVDESRKESFETDGSKREVPVYFYYPDAENAGENVFPLVIFSHGAFGYYQSNTSTYMELASNGYVVISLDHPYHSFFTRDTDGKLITVNPDFLQEVMAANEESATEEEIFALSRKWLSIRTADINFVLDSVKNAKAEESCPAEWFIESEETGNEISKALAMADIAHIGLMGHSMGGAASVSVGRERDDIGAVIDLDGTMLGEQLSYEDGVYQYNDAAYPAPLLAIDNEEHYQYYREDAEKEELYVNQAVLENTVAGEHTYFVGSGHMNFTDLPLFSPILASLLGTGTVDETECVRTMNEIILQYYNFWLKGEGEINIKESY
ncbi:MAG: hypothetical protein Q4C58_13475 [Eubacteriales bacterium]|nr:hypothetical protein [Eubacteriales bacterium]